MRRGRPAGISPSVAAWVVLVGVAATLLAAAGPAVSADQRAVPTKGPAVQVRPKETSLAAWESQLALPDPIVARLEWAQRSLAPSGFEKLERLARSIAPRIASGIEPAAIEREAEKGLNTVFSEAGLSGMDVSEAAFLVMAMATKDMDDDLRLVMAEIRATAAAKQKLRDQIRELQDRIAAEMNKAGQATTDLDRGAASSARGVRPGTASAQPTASARRVVSSEKVMLPVLGWEFAKAPVITPLLPPDAKVSVESLRSLVADLEQRLDGMNELTEMTSLRLQMTMDRRSKFIETLSNIMKKLGTTMETLVQNLK